jgi:hypothetical protein
MVKEKFNFWVEKFNLLLLDYNPPLFGKPLVRHKGEELYSCNLVLNRHSRRP